MTRQVDAFRVAADILDGAGICWWLADGAALGAVREGRFLPSDPDVDIGVWAGDHQAAVDAFADAGHPTHPRAIDPTPGVDGVKVDIHPHHRSGPAVWYDLGLGKVRYLFPADLFDRFDTVEFCGRPVKVPSPAGDYLSVHYGDDWRTPRRGWRWDTSPPCARPLARVSANITAHPKRAGWAEQLAAQLDVPVVWDQINTVWDTKRRAWLSADPDADYHLCIEDDAIVAPHLAEALPQIAAAADGHPVNLVTIDYKVHGLDRISYDQAAARGEHWWASQSGCNSGIATLLPVRDVADMVAFGDGHPSKHDDVKINRFYRGRGIPIRFTIPSLVQHRPASSNPSLVPGNGVGNRTERDSSSFIGVGRSAFEVDWRPPGNVRGIGAAMRFRHRRTGKEIVAEPGSVAARRVGRHLDRWEQVGADRPDPPPRHGRGSGRDAWAGYATAAGAGDIDGLSRDEIIAKLESKGLL